MNIAGQPSACGDTFVAIDLMKGLEGWRHSDPTGPVHWKEITFQPEPRREAITAANPGKPWWSTDARPASTFANGIYLAGTTRPDQDGLCAGGPAVWAGGR